MAPAAEHWWVTHCHTNCTLLLTLNPGRVLQRNLEPLKILTCTKCKFGTDDTKSVGWRLRCGGLSFAECAARVPVRVELELRLHVVPEKRHSNLEVVGSYVEV